MERQMAGYFKLYSETALKKDLDDTVALRLNNHAWSNCVSIIDLIF